MPEANESLAAQYVNKFVNATNQHIFLTGKAGTGKTTLLKEIVETTHKKTIIAAPTGIAAINAGGVTLHSLFHLPFGAFFPSNIIDTNSEINIHITTPQKLIREIKMNATKRALLREMELLIIDEVSMLRADLLDAIDTTLRYVRRNSNPFGGIQILFIGDLWQLPPVVKDDERELLKAHYTNVFFFNALALKENPPIYIELDKIYRQSDKNFIDLLNNFRVNKITKSDIDTLNKHYKQGFSVIENEGYIYLTTHNYKADNINSKALEKISGKTYSFDANVEGDYNEYAYPVEYTLKLKKGAQVMFIKNDYSGNGAYFNGKIGKVESISDEFIKVSFDDGSEPAFVEEYTWENKRFSLNNETREIEEKIVGAFKHFPIKLAWAITVHKSQGLTFDKAMIDISQAFAAGQTYVALSRLTSLKGLVLASPIRIGGPDIDDDLVEFANSKAEQVELKNKFEIASVEFVNKQVFDAFSFKSINAGLQEHISSYNKDEKRSAKQKYYSWAKDLYESVKPLAEVSGKFQTQINGIIHNGGNDYLTALNQRVLAAKQYFTPLFETEVSRINNHIKTIRKEKGTKKYLNELKSLEGLFYSHILSICKAEALCKAVLNNTELDKKSVQELAISFKPIVHKEEKETTKGKAKNKKDKKDKRSTYEITYELHIAGKSVDEIAKERSMNPRTIEGHISNCIEEGKIKVEEIVPKNKIIAVKEVAEELDTMLLSPIKELLGDDFSYPEIKYVVASIKNQIVKNE